MNPDNTIIKGPAFVYGSALSDVAGHAFFTKSPITIKRTLVPLVVGTDAVPNLDQRLNTILHEVTFTPSGRVAEITDLLTPAWGLYPGAKVMNKTSVAVNSVATASAGTKISVTLASATLVHVGQYVTLTGMSVAGYDGSWYVSTVTSSTVIVLDKAYTSTATGTCVVPKCLIIHPLRQDSAAVKTLVYQFAGVASYPELKLSAGDTALGAVTVNCIEHPYRDGKDASETLVKELAWSAPGSALLELLDAAEIPTLPPRLRFAEASVDAFTGSDTAAQPWKEFASLDGVTINTNLSASPDTTDHKGYSNWTVQQVTVTATVTPVGEDITPEAVQALMRPSGTGRGQTLSPDVLAFYAMLEDSSHTYLLSIPKAVAVGTQADYGSNTPRNGPISFNAVRTLTTGAQNPMASFEEV